MSKQNTVAFLFLLLVKIKSILLHIMYMWRQMDRLVLVYWLINLPVIFKSRAQQQYLILPNLNWSSTRFFFFYPHLTKRKPNQTVSVQRKNLIILFVSFLCGQYSRLGLKKKKKEIMISIADFQGREATRQSQERVVQKKKGQFF